MLGLRVVRGAPEWVYRLYRDSLIADRRDAIAMLVMVESGYSKVLQAPTGDWAWYRHPQPRVAS